MAKRTPTLLCADTQPHTVNLTLRVDADIIDFSGHFEHFPLLPGVTQIDWALRYAREYLSVPTSFQGMEVIKFQEPILPDMTVQLALSWDEEKQKLAFSYSSQREGLNIIHSSGKMKLGEICG
ncbi:MULTISPECIES: ApeI family dehydratase [Vibrio]|uniref:ApeI family dehydratase n=1 Tax=Vibrio TaxID=662 RepID=UPI000B8E94B9|nr:MULTISPECIES: 3-hydroxyacyl-ACP dehydratase [Vibrio]MDQ2164846.1 3-hydroxyacyl-ACP dehydratase [Vibrio anguillarum]NNN96250.1 3-hydroxyacyl-ACP dehydratase [Vibrio sp. B4-6]OXX71434.1 3-hydroxyacyl-ACP dehydratase [Vibrio sp. V19_P1S1T109]PRQ61895.1 3-hydroxyacyl-ACP dehydratase [Vibrio sp. V01_P9A10T6]